MPEQVQVFRGMPSAALQLIKETVLPSVKSETKRIELERWINELIIEATPAVSFKRRLSRRKNTPGFSQDAMRSYASYFWHGSNHMARITYGERMRETIDAFRKETSSAPKRESTDVSKRTQMIDFLEDHLENLLNPTADWAQLRSVAFTWWLGFSPVSAVLNFTQLPIVTAPFLTEKFGTLRGLKAMTRATTSLTKMYGDPKEIASNLSEADNILIQLGLQQNFLEESLATELAGLANGGELSRNMHGTAAGRGMSSFAEAAGWMFQGSEKINRRISFMAAVKLMRENPDNAYGQELRNTKKLEYDDLRQTHGLSELEATAFLAGKDTVQKTQFEYAQYARPRFMRGKKGVIFTFYMFSQNMLWNTFNSPSNKRMLLVHVCYGWPDGFTWW